MKYRGSILLLAVISSSCHLSLDSSISKKSKTINAQFIDAPVNGLTYKLDGDSAKSGLTKGKGQFECTPGQKVEFEIGKPGKGLSLGKATCGEKIFIYDLDDVQNDPDKATFVGGILQTIAPPGDTETPMNIPDSISGLDFHGAGLPTKVGDVSGSGDEEALSNFTEGLNSKTSLGLVSRSFSDVNNHMAEVALKNSESQTTTIIKNDSPLANALISPLGEPRSSKNYLKLDEKNKLPDLLHDISLNLKGSASCSGVDSKLGLNYYRQEGQVRLHVYSREEKCKENSSYGHCFGETISDKASKLGALDFDSKGSDGKGIFAFDLKGRMDIINGRVEGFVIAKTPKGENCAYRVNQSLAPTTSTSSMKPFAGGEFSPEFYSKKFKYQGMMCFTATKDLEKKFESDSKELENRFAEFQFSTQGIQGPKTLTVPSYYAITDGKLSIQSSVMSRYFLELQTIGNLDTTSQFVGYINSGKEVSNEKCLLYFETVKSDGLLTDFRAAKYERQDVVCKYKDDRPADESLVKNQDSLNASFIKQLSISSDKKLFSGDKDLTEFVKSVEGKSVKLLSPDIEMFINFTFQEDQTSGNVDLVGFSDIDFDCKFTFTENDNSGTPVDPVALTVPESYYGEYKVSIKQCFKHVESVSDSAVDAAQDYVLNKIKTFTLKKEFTQVDKLLLVENYSSSEQATLNLLAGNDSLQLVLNAVGSSSGDFVVSTYSSGEKVKLVACNLNIEKVEETKPEPVESACSSQALKGINLVYGFKNGTSNGRYLCSDSTAAATIAPTNHLDIEYNGIHSNISGDDFLLTCGDKTLAVEPITNAGQPIPSNSSYRHLLKLPRPLIQGESCVLSLSPSHNIVSAAGSVPAENISVVFNVFSPGKVSFTVDPFSTFTLDLNPGQNWITIKANQYVDGLQDLSLYELTCNAGSFNQTLTKSWSSPFSHAFQLGMSSALPSNSLCRFSMKGMKDANGNPISDNNFDFTTTN